MRVRRISTVLHIYESSPRRMLRYVQRPFGTLKLRNRNSATKVRSSVAAADLKKLKMRGMHKRVKLWKIYILLHGIERANVRIDEFGIFGSANLNVIAA
jgi:hypothetical protein